jgi:pimeloyl-ACP methyl ester carboxylesterase
VRELAQELAERDYTVVIWDRPNCGESDIHFEGETESILSADTLVGLLRKLESAPALLVGASAGSRVSLIAAHRHPDAVRSIAALWITGDAIGLASLVGVYCGGLYVATKIGGLEASLGRLEHYGKLRSQPKIARMATAKWQGTKTKRERENF